MGQPGADSGTSPNGQNSNGQNGSSGAGGIDEGDESLDRWIAENEAKAQRFQRMRDGVQQVSTTETSRDGVVTVTVDAAGNMIDLGITDGVKQMSGSKVSSEVLGTMRKAQSRLADQVAQVVSATVGDDQSTMDTMLSSYRGKFPEPEDDEQDFGRPRDRGVHEIQLDDFEEE